MTSADRKELRRFAERLILIVRDQSIVECDRLASGVMIGKDGDRWNSLLETDAARKAIQELTPDIVDQVLFELLNAIDTGDLPLGWRRTDGSLVGLDELGMGEMAGWLMGSPGWRHEYSRQRFFDPLSELRLDLDPEA